MTSASRTQQSRCRCKAHANALADSGWWCFGRRRTTDPLIQKRRREQHAVKYSKSASDITPHKISAPPREEPATIEVAAEPVDAQLLEIKCGAGQRQLRPSAATAPSSSWPIAAKVDGGAKRVKTDPYANLPSAPACDDDIDSDPADETDKCERRKARNREAAAKSRQRQQDHRRSLEVGLPSSPPPALSCLCRRCDPERQRAFTCSVSRLIVRCAVQQSCVDPASASRLNILPQHPASTPCLNILPQTLPQHPAST